MQKSGRRGGRYAGCDIIPRASRRAADRIFRRPADSLPPFFSCFARKQRAAAREACSGRYRTVVCLPLTSTLLDKDNAPSLIRFGSLSSTRAGKNLDRSQEQVTSSFIPLPELFGRKGYSQRSGTTLVEVATNFFLYTFPRRGTQRSRRGKYGQRRKRGEEEREGIRNGTKIVA